MEEEPPESQPPRRFELNHGEVGGDESTNKTSALKVYSRLVDEFRRLPDASETITRIIQAEPDPTLARDLRHMFDRVAFAQEILGFQPESEIQEHALRTHARHIIFNCNRQWGKSTIAAVRALHRAWFWPGSFILIVSRAQAQTGELMKKIKAFLPELGILKPKGDGLHRASVELPNGSRIVALPGGEKPTRAYSSVAMLIIDEASIVPDPVHEAVNPVLSRTNGDLMLLSTPRGKRGIFYRIWTHGGPTWERIFGPVTASSRIAQDFLETVRRDHGDDFFAQEYMCEFLERDAFLFNDDEIQQLFSQDFDAWEFPK